MSADLVTLLGALQLSGAAPVLPAWLDRAAQEELGYADRSWPGAARRGPGTRCEYSADSQRGWRRPGGAAACSLPSLSIMS